MTQARIRTLAMLLGVCVLGSIVGCTKKPEGPDREFAYVSNGGSNNVSVIDLNELRLVASLPTGSNPSGVSANPMKDEVYAVNSDSGTVTVIDSAQNRIAGSMQVGAKPFFAAVSTDGKRAY